MQLLRHISGFGTLSQWAVRLMETCAASCSSSQSRREFSRNKSRIGEDAELVNAALAGRPGSIEALVRQVRPAIFKVARAMSGSRHDTADLSEKIFLRVFQLLKRYRSETPLVDWSKQAAISAGLCELSSHGWACDVSNWTEDDVRLLEAIDAGSDGVTSTRAAQLLDRMLDRLTPAERLVKRLHDLEDFSFEEICRWTGWSEGRVRKTAESAKRRMDELLIEICPVTAQRPL